MEKNLTAVEWIELKLNSVKPTDFCSIETIKDWIKQSKAMEKEQIIVAHNDGALMAYALPFNAPFKKGEEYYNETYGKI
jgi:hypothetical protein